MSTECYISGTFAVTLSPAFNPLNAKLNPICHLLALLESATIVDVSRLRVKFVNNCKKNSKNESILNAPFNFLHNL